MTQTPQNELAPEKIASLNNAGFDLDALRKVIVESKTAKELNDMIKYLNSKLYAQPEVLKAVHDAMRQQFRILGETVSVTAGTLTNLDELKAVVEAGLKAVEPVTKPVKGIFTSAFDTMNGWMGGGLAWLGNAFDGFEAPAWSKRGLYYGCVYSKWLGLGFLPFGAQLEEFGKKKLAKLDMEEATGVEPYKGRFAFNPADDDPRWPAFMTNLPTKGQTAKSAIVMYMEKVRNAAPPVPGTPDVITLEKLQKFLDNPKDIDTEIAASASDKKKEQMMVLPEWKTLGVAKIEWSDTVTSFDKTTKTLTLSQANIGPDGKGITGTNAEQLMNISRDMGNADILTLGTSQIVLERRADGKKGVSLPTTMDTSFIPMLNEIIARAKWNRYKKIVVESNDQSGDQKVVLTFDGGSGILNVPTNSQVLVTLRDKIGTPLSMDHINSNSGGSWTLTNGNDLVPDGQPAVPVTT
ncbi:MAG: hypothetical protein PHZ00_06955 [Candidatus Peribacteraceae bacterium]|nr:hypothetical protein [Candidatus Peribacteraceae bacterium]